MVGGMISVPLIISTVFCFNGDWVTTAEIFGTMFFVSGIGTLLQCLIGCRSELTIASVCLSNKYTNKEIDWFLPIFRCLIIVVAFSVFSVLMLVVSPLTDYVTIIGRVLVMRPACHVACNKFLCRRIINSLSHWLRSKQLN